MPKRRFTLTQANTIIWTFFIANLFCVSVIAQDLTEEEKLLEKASKGNGIEKIKAYYDLSYLYQFNNINKAIDFDELALEEAIRISDSSWIARIYLDLGYINNYKGDLEQSLKYTLLGKRIAESAKAKEVMAIAYHDLGLFYSNLSLYDKSIEYYQKSLKIKNELGQSSKAASTLNNIGLVYNNLKDYENAEDYLNQALDIQLSLNDSLRAVSTLINLGVIYNNQNNFEKSLQFLEKASSYIESGVRYKKIEILYSVLSDVYYNLGDFNYSHENLKKTIKIADSLNNIAVLSSSYQLLSKLHIKNNELNLAKNYLAQSQHLAEEVSYKQNMLDNFQLYVQIYEKINKIDSALYYQKKYTELQESIFNEGLARNVANLQIALQEAQEEIAEKDISITKQSQLNYFLFIIVILSIALVGLIYRNYIVTNRANRRLSESKSEIELQKDDLERKNKQLAEAQKTIRDQNSLLLNVNAELERAVNDRTKELARSKEGLEKAVHELDLFIYKASHDLRGPIATMQGVVNLGLLDAKEESSLQYFQTLQKISGNLNDVLFQLIEVHEAYQREAILERFDAGELIKATIEEYQVDDRLKEIDIRLDLNMNSNWVSDRKLLKLILGSMLINASFYKKNRGEAYIALKIEQKEKSLLLSIEDNGYGIQEQDIPKVFSLFFKGSPKSGGTGLEIYAAKIAVEKLQGEMKLVKPRGNMTFMIDLPKLKLV
jgi:signal transduction histidine kinase